MGSEIRQKSPEEALRALQRLCARSEKSCSDAERLMTRWKVDPRSVSGIIDRLVADGYIDQTRYACAFARDKVRFYKWGGIKISAALRAKRIPQSVIDTALAQFPKEEAAGLVEEVIRRKLRSLGGEHSSENRAKCFRLALQRGYESEIVQDACSRIFSE